MNISFPCIETALMKNICASAGNSLRIPPRGPRAPRDRCPAARLLHWLPGVRAKSKCVNFR